MWAELSLPRTCEALVGLETGSYHAAAQSEEVEIDNRFTTGGYLPYRKVPNPDPFSRDVTSQGTPPAPVLYAVMM